MDWGRNMTREVGIRGIHGRLNRNLGRAADHECIGCGGQAREWAYQHPTEGTTFSQSMSDYAPMCRPCHTRFDIAAGQRPTPPGSPEGALAASMQKQRRMAVDEDYAARMKAASSKGARTTLQMRRACGDCGLVSTPGGLGLHLKATGHARS